MTALDIHLDHFAYRLMRDAMNEGTARPMEGCP